MKRFLLRVGTDPEAPANWLMGEGDTVARLGSVDRLEEAADLCADADEVILMLRGGRAATRRLLMPVKRDAALAAASRLAFEDILATPAEECHFAFGEADEQGRRIVSAVPSDWFAEWMEAIDAAGIYPDIVTVDHLVLAAEADEGVILNEADQVIIQLPDGGMTVSHDFARAIVSQLEGAKDAKLIDISKAGSAGSIYLSALTKGTPPSFLRGVHQPKRDWLGMFQEWKVPASLAAAGLLVWLSGSLVEAVRHDMAAGRITERAEQIFTEAYPGVPIRDLSRQASIRSVQAQTPLFLPLSTALAEALEDTSGVELAGIRYEVGNGLTADLRFPDAADLEALREQLEARGIPVEEGTNLRRDDDGRFAGQLRLMGVSS